MPKQKGPKQGYKLNKAAKQFIESEVQKDEGLKARELQKRINIKLGISIHIRTIERALKKRV